MDGEKIKEYRTKLKMTQTELAEALGISRNTIARWERNEIKPQSEQMLELALEQLILQKTKSYSRELVEKTYREITQSVEKTKQILDELDQLDKEKSYSQIRPRPHRNLAAK